MKTVIAILVLLLASITATVFTVKDSPPIVPTSETQITITTTEKETATEILSVTESETEAYEIETETVAPTTERKAETTTQKPATTKPITTTTKRTAAPSTTQAPVTTTKPVTTTASTTTQPTTKAQTIDIDYYVNFAIEYGKSIGLKYLPDANSCWDTPIIIASDNHDSALRDIQCRLNRYKNLEGDEYFCVWAEPYKSNQYELYIGYA